AVRTAAARAVGGWEAQFLWGEDVDFSQRILRRYPGGGALTYCEKAVMFHRNRDTREGLARAARSYGRGAALVYRRYPTEARWRFFNPAVIAGVIGLRGVVAGLMGLARRIGLADAGRAELRQYHALWSWHFWGGFLEQYYARAPMGVVEAAPI